MSNRAETNNAEERNRYYIDNCIYKIWPAIEEISRQLIQESHKELHDRFWEAANDRRTHGLNAAYSKFCSILDNLKGL